MASKLTHSEDARSSLTWEECFGLVVGEVAGRVNFTRHAMPAPIAVRCTVVGHDLLLRPEARTGLGRLLDDAVVALEVDLKDGAAGTLWRVVVVGLASAVSAGEGRWVRLHPTDVTCHRLPSPRSGRPRPGKG